MTQTVSPDLAVVVPLPRRVPEQVERLAAALEANGLGPDFCRWQPRDTETWGQAASLLEAWGCP